jgi:hypothetical protein
MHEDRTHMCASYMENDTLLIKEEDFEDTKKVVNSFKFVDTYFRGFWRKCTFMGTDVRLSPAIVSICVYGDKYSLNF